LLEDKPDKASYGRIAMPLVGVAVFSCVIALAYCVATEWLGMAAIRFLNHIGPAVLGVVCGACGYLSIKNSPIALWSPIPWFLLSCAGFYGLGPLAYHFATPETVSFLDGLYVVDEKSLLRTNLLNAAGIAAVSFTIAITLLMAPSSIGRMQPYNHVLTKKLMWTFIAVAAPVKYFLVVPYIMGKLSYVPPGAFLHLADFLGSAIIVMFILLANGEKKYVPLLAIVLLSELAFGLLALSKTVMIQTALITCLGIWLYRRSISVLITSGLAIIFVYSLVLSPFVLFARTVIGASSAKETADVNIAISAYESVGLNELAVLSPEVQGWWTRLSYANVQAFAMERFNEGNRGKTFDLFPYVFVPRIIDPDKPLMHLGQDFTQLILGYEDTSHTGLGVFGEAYWNGGWPLVIVASMYVGVIIGIIARFAMFTMLSGEYIFLPIILLGIQLGLTGLTDWFVSTFVGGLIEAMFWLFLLYALKAFLKVRIAPRLMPLSTPLPNSLP